MRSSGRELSPFGEDTGVAAPSVTLLATFSARGGLTLAACDGIGGVAVLLLAGVVLSTTLCGAYLLAKPGHTGAAGFGHDRKSKIRTKKSNYRDCLTMAIY